MRTEKRIGEKNRDGMRWKEIRIDWHRGVDMRTEKMLEKERRRDPPKKRGEYKRREDWRKVKNRRFTMDKKSEARQRKKKYKK